MTRFGSYAALGLAISVASLLCFTYLAGSPAAQFRHAAVAGYLLATVAFFLWASRSFDLTALLRLACVIALLSTLGDQILGFAFLPGLAKDVEPFSWHHVITAASILGVLMGWYLAVAFFASVVARIVRRSARSE